MRRPAIPDYQLIESIFVRLRTTVISPKELEVLYPGLDYEDSIRKIRQLKKLGIVEHSGSRNYRILVGKPLEIAFGPFIGRRLTRLWQEIQKQRLLDTSLILKDFRN